MGTHWMKSAPGLRAMSNERDDQQLKLFHNISPIIEAAQRTDLSLPVRKAGKLLGDCTVNELLRIHDEMDEDIKERGASVPR